ncbi:MAG: hypothetical protein AB8I08_17360 [Sandaracinaceae bacterium]
MSRKAAWGAGVCLVLLAFVSLFLWRSSSRVRGSGSGTLGTTSVGSGGSSPDVSLSRSSDAGPPADASPLPDVPSELPDLTPEVIAELERRESAIEVLRERLATMTERMLEHEMGGDLAASDRLAEEMEAIEEELETQQTELERRQREEHIDNDDPLTLPVR